MRREKVKRGGTPDFLIPAALLAPYLEEGIERLNQEVDSLEGLGGRTALSARAAAILGDVGEEAVYRRLYAVRNGGCRAVHTEIADAMLLAIDVAIGDTDLPTLAGTKAGAREMIEVWAPEVEGVEAERLASTMLHFCNGLLEGLSTDLDELAPVAEPERELVAA